MYKFKRYRQPLIHSTVLDVFDADGQLCVQAVACDDTPHSLMVAFSRDGGRTWWGYHTQRDVTLDEFQSRFETVEAQR